MTINPLPPAIADLGLPQRIEPITVGRSCAAVYRLTLGEQRYYLKVMAEQPGVSFKKDAEILRWLAGKLPVPQVKAYTRHEGHEYLLLTDVAGQNAVELIGQMTNERLVQELATGLRQIHSLPIEGCPSDETTPAKLARAKNNVALGRVDESDFDPERQGQTAQNIYQTLIKTARRDDDLVFTHGDYCLPNVIFNEGQVAGFIDMDRAGIGHRYNDLAIASRSIRDNLGSEYEALFFNHYGLTQIDFAKIDFYRTLDELF